MDLDVAEDVIVVGVLFSLPDPLQNLLDFYLRLKDHEGELRFQLDFRFLPFLSFRFLQRLAGRKSFSGADHSSLGGVFRRFDHVNWDLDFDQILDGQALDVESVPMVVAHLPFSCPRPPRRGIVWDFGFMFLVVTAVMAGHFPSSMLPLPVRQATELEGDHRSDHMFHVGAFESGVEGVVFEAGKNVESA